MFLPIAICMAGIKINKIITRRAFTKMIGEHLRSQCTPGKMEQAYEAHRARIAAIKTKNRIERDGNLYF